MRWATAFVILLVATVMLWLSVPRFIASVLKAPAHVTALAAYHNLPLSRSELARAATYLERARGWENSADLNSQLGFLLLLQAGRTTLDNERRVVATKAAQALEQGLLLSPFRPHPWVRLAFARGFMGEETPRIVYPLEQSIEIGPYVGEIAIVRLRLLLLAWDYLSPGLKLYTYQQIRYIWPNAMGDLLEVAKATPRPDVIRFALRPVPGAAERLDQVLSAN